MLRTIGILLLVAAPAGVRPARGDAGALSADSLLERARAHLADSTIESCRLAVEELERASRIAPARAELWSEYARACEVTGQRERARGCLERAARVAPDRAEFQLGLGRAWKRDWLATLDDSSRTRALRCLMRASADAPRDPAPRVEIVALALAKGDLELARRAARSAIWCDPEAPDALLALGATAYRLGALGAADSAFRAALPRLPAEAQVRFSDLRPLRSGGGAPRAGAQGGAETFWAAVDPDLTTPENEAELDFMARVAEALLLFRDEGHVDWDMRAELLVRYGVPERVTLHPPDRELVLIYNRYVRNLYAPDPLEYPYAMQVWSYPALGIRAELWDRGLSGRYELPIGLQRDPDPRPDPARLLGRADLVVLGGGRGVVRALPPGVTPLAATAELSRFPADSLVRLVAHVAAAGGPADTIRASWAVADAEGHRLAAESGPLSLSGCEPLERRVANFAASLPPGSYRVDVAVRKGRGRGVVHLTTSVAEPPRGLALSDLVLVCGTPSGAGGEPVRIEPNLERRMRGSGSLSAYFEVSHLAADEGGRSRFAYTCAVRPAEPEVDPGRPAEPAYQATREEENAGALRRQFVSVPLKGLRRGSWVLEVEIRDLVSGARASTFAAFVRE